VAHSPPPAGLGGRTRRRVDTIGVAPDHLAPQTADDLSSGRDPGVDKALSLLS
jgi:carboxyl-terminal processing protease